MLLEVKHFSFGHLISECALINHKDWQQFVEKQHAAFAIVKIKITDQKDYHTLLGRAPFEWSFNASSVPLF